MDKENKNALMKNLEQVMKVVEYNIMKKYIDRFFSNNK